jgi:hypothetical protein
MSRVLALIAVLMVLAVLLSAERKKENLCPCR